MDKKLSKKGLRIIAAECQNSSKEEVGKLIKEQKAKFTVTTGVEGPISVRGIPHAVVFDVKGKLIFNGHPMDESFKKVIKKALKDVKNDDDDANAKPAEIFAQRSWTNQDGKSIKAAILEVKDDSVTFRMPNGKKVPYKLEKLSEEDQKLIAEKVKEMADE